MSIFDAIPRYASPTLPTSLVGARFVCPCGHGRPRQEGEDTLPPCACGRRMGIAGPEHVADASWAWPWMTTTTGHRLHAVEPPADPDAAEEVLLAQASVDLATRCRQRLPMSIAGPLERVGMERCVRCCRHLGVPPGRGLPGEHAEARVRRRSPRPFPGLVARKARRWRRVEAVTDGVVEYVTDTGRRGHCAVRVWMDWSRTADVSPSSPAVQGQALDGVSVPPVCHTVASRGTGSGPAGPMRAPRNGRGS